MCCLLLINFKLIERVFFFNFLKAILFAIFFSPILLLFRSKHIKNSKYIKQAFIIGLMAYILGILNVLLSNGILAVIGNFVAVISLWVIIFGLNTSREERVPLLTFIFSFIILQIIAYIFKIDIIQVAIFEHEGTTAGFCFYSIIPPLIIALISCLFVRKTINKEN